MATENNIDNVLVGHIGIRDRILMVSGLLNAIRCCCDVLWSIPLYPDSDFRLTVRGEGRLAVHGQKRPFFLVFVAAAPTILRRPRPLATSWSVWWGDLFRNPVQGGDLILVSPNGKHRAVTKGSDLYPIIVDRVHVRLWKEHRIARQITPTKC